MIPGASDHCACTPVKTAEGGRLELPRAHARRFSRPLPYQLGLALQFSQKYSHFDSLNQLLSTAAYLPKTSCRFASVPANVRAAETLCPVNPGYRRHDSNIHRHTTLPGKQQLPSSPAICGFKNHDVNTACDRPSLTVPAVPPYRISALHLRLSTSSVIRRPRRLKMRSRT